MLTFRFLIVVFYQIILKGRECGFQIASHPAVFAQSQSMVRYWQLNMPIRFSLKEEKTKQRELRVFSKTMDGLDLKDVKCMVICEDASKIEVYDEVEIELINIIEWLLEVPYEDGNESKS